MRCLKYSLLYNDSHLSGDDGIFKQCNNLKPMSICLTLLKLEYSGITGSMSWLMMSWLLVSPGHQHPWYPLCRINGSWFSMRISHVPSQCWVITENVLNKKFLPPKILCFDMYILRYWPHSYPHSSECLVICHQNQNSFQRSNTSITMAEHCW